MQCKCLDLLSEIGCHKRMFHFWIDEDENWRASKTSNVSLVAHIFLVNLMFQWQSLVLYKIDVQLVLNNALEHVWPVEFPRSFGELLVLIWFVYFICKSKGKFEQRPFCRVVNVQRQSMRALHHGYHQAKSHPSMVDNSQL